MAKEASKKDDKALSKAEQKAAKKKEKADKKAAKKNKAELTPYQRAMRNMYWLALTLAFCVVLYLGYEAYMLLAANTKL